MANEVNGHYSNLNSVSIYFVTVIRYAEQLCDKDRIDVQFVLPIFSTSLLINRNLSFNSIEWYQAASAACRTAMRRSGVV
jgi:hypothetical protein